eukprot:gene7984-5544_t
MQLLWSSTSFLLFRLRYFDYLPSLFSFRFGESEKESAHFLNVFGLTIYNIS